MSEFRVVEGNVTDADVQRRMDEPGEWTWSCPSCPATRPAASMRESLELAAAHRCVVAE